MNKNNLPTVVRELKGWQGRACLVKRGDEYFVVSSVNAPFSGPETLAFRADAKGNVESFTEVAGGRRMSREEVLSELAEGVTV